MYRKMWVDEMKSIEDKLYCIILQVKIEGYLTMNMGELVKEI